MPTEDGKETIGERLTRLRADLARVDQTIARVETNGRTFDLGGGTVTQMSYDAALRRKRELERDILRLEARLGGMNTRVAQIHSAG